MAMTQTASLNDFLKSNYGTAYEQSMQPYYERMQYPTNYMSEAGINPDSYGPALLDSWKTELGALPEEGFGPGGVGWQLDMPQEEFFNKYYGPESGWSGAGNASYDPATGQVSYKTFDDEYDFGNTLIGLGAAGLGALSGGFGLGELFGGAGGGMTGSATELTSPTNFAGWSSDAAGGNMLDLGEYGVGEFGGMPESFLPGESAGIPIGNESDWFGGMTPGQIGVENGGTMLGGGAYNLGSASGGIGELIKKIFGGGSGTPGSYSFPWGTALSSLLGYAGNKSSQKDLEGLLREMMAAQDPFASQRPRYQEQLRGLTSTPSNFFQDPAIAQAIQSAMDQSNRSLVSQGYNMSGNQMTELTKVAQNEAFKQFMPYLNQIGGFAGAGFGPGNMSGLASLGTAGVNQGQQGLGNLGVGLEAILRGQQPNLVQILQGAQPNQGLLDLFKNSLG